ncbi:MAG: hypothetical protein ACI90V_004478 [Bacillariaceae sp.]|jgi:hypothetical protein
MYTQQNYLQSVELPTQCEPQFKPKTNTITNATTHHFFSADIYSSEGILIWFALIELTDQVFIKSSSANTFSVLLLQYIAENSSYQ